MGIHDSVDTEIVEMQPEDAQVLLGAFKSAGKVDQKLVRTYADDMKAGRWILNGTSIVLSQDRKILDGRARLLACIQSKAPFKTLIIRNIEDSSFETIDAVRKRRLPTF